MSQPLIPSPEPVPTPTSPQFLSSNTLVFSRKKPPLYRNRHALTKIEIKTLLGIDSDEIDELLAVMRHRLPIDNDDCRTLAQLRFRPATVNRIRARWIARTDQLAYVMYQLFLFAKKQRSQMKTRARKRNRDGETLDRDTFQRRCRTRADSVIDRERNSAQPQQLSTDEIAKLRQMFGELELRNAQSSQLSDRQLNDYEQEIAERIETKVSERVDRQLNEHKQEIAEKIETKVSERVDRQLNEHKQEIAEKIETKVSERVDRQLNEHKQEIAEQIETEFVQQQNKQSSELSAGFDLQNLHIKEYKQELSGRVDLQMKEHKQEIAEKIETDIVIAKQDLSVNMQTHMQGFAGMITTSLATLDDCMSSRLQDKISASLAMLDDRMSSRLQDMISVSLVTLDDRMSSGLQNMISASLATLDDRMLSRFRDMELYLRKPDVEVADGAGDHIPPTTNADNGLERINFVVKIRRVGTGDCQVDHQQEKLYLCDGSTRSILRGPPVQQFFSPERSGQELFAGLYGRAIPLLRSGTSIVCILYGMSGTGKTSLTLGSQQDPGLIAQLLTAIAPYQDPAGEYAVAAVETIALWEDPILTRSIKWEHSAPQLQIFFGDLRTRLSMTTTPANRQSSRAHLIITVSLSKKQELVFVDICGEETGVHRRQIAEGEAARGGGAGTGSGEKETSNKIAADILNFRLLLNEVVREDPRTGPGSKRASKLNTVLYDKLMKRETIKTVVVTATTDRKTLAAYEALECKVAE